MSDAVIYLQHLEKMILTAFIDMNAAGVYLQYLEKMINKRFRKKIFC